MRLNRQGRACLAQCGHQSPGVNSSIPLVPHATQRMEQCQTPGTLVMAMSCFTHTGPFKVSLLQARPQRGPVQSEGQDWWSVCQTVITAGGLKPDEFYSVKHQSWASWGCQRGFCEGTGWTGMCKGAGRESLFPAACGSDFGTEFTASPNNAGMGWGAQRRHLLSI